MGAEVGSEEPQDGVGEVPAVGDDKIGVSELHLAICALGKKFGGLDPTDVTILQSALVDCAAVLNAAARWLPEDVRGKIKAVPNQLGEIA